MSTTPAQPMSQRALASITAALHDPGRGRGARRTAAVAAFVTINGETTAKDIATATGFPMGIAATYLSRASREGRIVRVAPGVYAAGARGQDGRRDSGAQYCAVDEQVSQNETPDKPRGQLSQNETVDDQVIQNGSPDKPRKIVGAAHSPDDLEDDSLAAALLALALEGRWDDVQELTTCPLTLAVICQAITTLLSGLSSHLTGINQYNAPVDRDHLAAHMRDWSLEHLRYALNERNQG